MAIGMAKSTGNTKSKIISTACKYFNHSGFSPVSLFELAQHMEMSRGNLTYHFKDKEGIAKVLYDSLLNRMNVLLDDIEQQFPTSKQRCRAVIELLFHLTETEPEVMEFIIYAKHKEFLPGNNPICSSRPFQKMRELGLVNLFDKDGELQIEANYQRLDNLEYQV